MRKLIGLILIMISTANLGVDFFSKRNIKLEDILPGYVNFISRGDSSVFYLPLGEDKYIRSSAALARGAKQTRAHL